MKRNLCEDERRNKKIKISTEFENFVSNFDSKYSVINYCIDTDDDILLNIIIKSWDDFNEIFSEFKTELKQRIVDKKSHRCYGYLSMYIQGCNNIYKDLMYL